MRISDWSSDVCSSDLVLDLADRVGGLVPRLVREVGVGRHAVDLDAEALELGVVVGQVTELGGAYEGEVGRVEEHHRPLALEVLVGHVHELALAEGGGLEGLDLGVDERSEEHTSELQSLMRISYAVFCLKKKKYDRRHKDTLIPYTA